MLAQPATRGAGVGEMAVDETPERARMAGDRQMSQLVDDHVVEHRWRAHHQPPAERKRASARSASPACPLIPDCDLVGLDAHLTRTCRDTVVNRTTGLRTQPCHEELGGRPWLHESADDDEAIVVDTDACPMTSVEGGDRDDPMMLAAEQDPAAGTEPGSRRESRPPNFDSTLVSLDPAPVPGDKVCRFPLGRPPR